MKKREEINEALQLANDIISYVGFDSWEMECLGNAINRFNAIINKYKINKRQENENASVKYWEYCDVCKKRFSVENGYIGHLVGRKHLSKLKAGNK